MKRRNGSAIITAIGMGIVLMLVIVGLHTFSSYRIQTTIQTSRKVKALALAEAALEIAMAEQTYNYGFETNEATKELTWPSKKDYSSRVKNDNTHGFKIKSNGQGTYWGTLGDGDFKFKVGRIPYKDDPRSKNINEEFAFVFIEAMGRYQDTVKRIRAVANRRFPAREFLMYDGDILSIVFGEPGDPSTNSFSTGHLYGHNGIEISRILTTRHNPTAQGTNQELADMNAVISGAGRIFLFSPIQAKFRDKPGLPGPNLLLPRNSIFPTNGTYSSPSAEEKGEFPQEIRNSKPEFPEDIKAKVGPWMKDKDDGLSLPLEVEPYDSYREDAKKAGKGLYFAANYADGKFAKNYRVPNGWTGTDQNKVKAILLDFGNNIKPGNVSLPANFNGVIFAEDNIIIKGNPPKDLNIVTPQNVFVAGDFNQAGDPGQLDEFYGMPQDYNANENALTARDYRDDVRSRLLDDSTSSGKKNHVAAKVVAGKRVVYDYRSPVDCFSNEIYPFMKYKLATYIAEESNAEDNTLKRNNSGKIIASATNADDFAADVKKFFQEYKIDGSAESGLEEEFKKLYDDHDGKFSFTDFDEACKKVWAEYADKYDPSGDGELTSVSKDEDYGVYKLLRDLRTKMGAPTNDPDGTFSPDKIKDQPGDFLYYPEMTTNGMFISWGKRNNLFYSGPDYIKIYNEIGCSKDCKTSNVGIRHSNILLMVHRLFGSEIYLRKNKVQYLKGGYYSPPTRKKLYDETLPNYGLTNSKHEMASYRILSWQDTIATGEEFENF